VTGTVRKLTDESLQASFSPDASQIAFRKGDSFWLMGPNGDDQRRFMALENGFDIQGPKWSPDGRRLLYLKRKLGGEESSIEARSLADGSTTVVLASKGLLDFWWTSDGRLIYTQAEDGNQTTYGLWEASIDAASARAAGEPRRLTRWVGFSPGFVSVSADGRRIATTKGYSQSDIYTAEFDAGETKLKTPRQLTLDTRSDLPAGWTARNEILFFSDRNGGFNIFKQAPSAQNAEPLITGQEDVRDPQMTPDAKWLLYTLWPDSKQSPRTRSVRVMRVAPSGGAAESVLDARGTFASGITWDRRKGFPDFRCTSAMASCILAEAEEREIVFTAFDPLQGRGPEVARVRTSPEEFFWDLSPDASQLVYGEFAWGAGDKLSVLTIRDRSTREVPLKTWTNLNSVSWSNDGQSLFLTTLRREGSTLLRASTSGKVDVLLEQNSRWMLNPRVSPDGRLLAFAVSATDSNVWLIETR